jgi:hypothetical protein
MGWQMEMEARFILTSPCSVVLGVWPTHDEHWQDKTAALEQSHTVSYFQPLILLMFRKKDHHI